MEYESVSLKELAAELALFSFVFLHCTTLCKRSVVPASKMCHLRKCCRYPACTEAENRSVTVNIVLRVCLHLFAVISPPWRVYRKTPLVYHQSILSLVLDTFVLHSFIWPVFPPVTDLFYISQDIGKSPKRLTAATNYY